MYARRWLKASEELRHNMDEYKELEKRTDAPQLSIWLGYKQREIENDIKQLVNEAKRIKKKRQLNYDIGFGIPRESFDNIVFKLIEHGQYGELFELLKNARKDEAK